MPQFRSLDPDEARAIFSPTKTTRKNVADPGAARQATSTLRVSTSPGAPKARERAAFQRNSERWNPSPQREIVPPFRVVQVVDSARDTFVVLDSKHYKVSPEFDTFEDAEQALFVLNARG